MKLLKLIFLLLIIFFLSSCAEKSTIATLQELETADMSLVDYINQPVPDPYEPVGFKEESNWTTWNKFWFGSAIAGQSADVASTVYQSGKGGCSEQNPVYGKDPNVVALVGLKAAVLGLGWWITEYWLADDGDEAQQIARNWIYGISAVVGSGAAAWNMSLDCD